MATARSRSRSAPLSTKNMKSLKRRALNLWKRVFVVKRSKNAEAAIRIAQNLKEKKSSRRLLFLQSWENCPEKVTLLTAWKKDIVAQMSVTVSKQTN